jgi:hypothetical protein
MIKGQFSLLFHNKRFLTSIFVVILFSMLWIVYQERSISVESQSKARALEWALDGDSPAETVKNAYLDILSNVYTGNSSDSLRFTSSLYDEITLYEWLNKYISSCTNYPYTLEKIIKEKGSVAAFPGASVASINKAELEKKAYSGLVGSVLAVPGNYISFEKFFTFGWIDIAVFILIFLICHFLIVEEREKGIGRLIFAEKNGGIRYYYAKLGSSVIISCCFALVLHLLYLVFLFSLYGTCDLNVSIQSMEGYTGCPWKLTIGEYFCIYLTWKTLGYALITLIALTICSFKLPYAVPGGVIFVLMFVCIMRKDSIPLKSLYIIRDSNPVQICTPQYWITGLRSYELFTSGDNTVFISGFMLPVISALLQIAVFGILGMIIFHNGLRQSSMSSKKRNLFSPYKYGKSIYINEIVFVLFKKKVIFIFAFIIAIYALFICDTKENLRQDVQMSRQVLEILNSKDHNEARSWLDTRMEQIHAAETELAKLSAKRAAAEISEAEYTSLFSYYSNQTIIKPIIEKYMAQADDMDAFIGDETEKYKDIKFEFEPLTDVLFGNKGNAEKGWISILCCFFITFVMMTALPGEHEAGIHRLTAGTPYGKKAFLIRAGTMLTLLFILNTALYLFWLRGLDMRFGTETLSNRSYSFRALRPYVLLRTGYSEVIGEILLTSLCITMIGGICILISTLLPSSAISESIGSIFLISVSALKVLQINSSIIPYSRFLVMGDVLYTKSFISVGVLIIFTAVVSIILNRGIGLWMKTK